MQEQLDELTTILEALVERDGPGALVIGATDVEVVYVAKTLSGLDERSETDLYLTFVARAPTARAFVDAVVESYSAQRMAVAEARLREGREALCSLPEAVTDAEASPATRIRLLIEDALALLPEGDHRLAWSLLPIEIGEREALAEMTESLLKGVLEDRLRLIVRDDSAAPGPLKTAEAWPDETIIAYEMAMTPGDLTAAAAATAQDPSKPPAERMSALLQLAYLDYGYQRFDAAMAKFSGLARYYDATGEIHFETLARAGVGDVQRAQGQLAEARATYEEALLKVAPTQAFPVTLQVCTCLGDTCRELGQHSDAEGYYRLADQIATSLANLYAKVDIAESIGACRLALGAPDEAAKIWSDAAEVCREIDYAYRLARILGHLVAIHSEQLPNCHLRRVYGDEKEKVDERLRQEGFA